MGTVDKLNVLGEAAQYDVCAAAGRPMPEGRDITRYIVPVTRRDGRRMPVLKVLQTNACVKDCYYCPFRAGRRFRREAFKPEELARLVAQLHRAGIVEGLFLSSGVVGQEDHTMAQIVATAEILRRKHGFRGYLHLKIMPGASDAAIEAALRLADRVSVNLEAPNPKRLARLTSTKDLQRDLLAPLQRVQELVAWMGRQVSRTTQFVVGAAGETDREILTTVHHLYRRLGLARVYYSAFRPIPDTPLESRPPEDPRRQDRLYQADALLRWYGFEPAELPLDPQGNLPLDEDPKTAWARRHPERFPVEVNTAAREELLRVPGIGPVATERILRWRRHGTFRDLAALRKAGAVAERAAPYITLAGRRPPLQLPLFAREGSVQVTQSIDETAQPSCPVSS